MKFQKLLNEQMVLRLIEDEVSSDKYVKAGGFFVEKNAMNDEFTHSYYARVLEACKNKHGIKNGDVVYLRKVYAREVYKDDDGPYMITTLKNIIARIHDFDIEKVFNVKKKTRRGKCRTQAT